MRYYATVASERATKGQGGNEYLSICILNEERETIAELFIESGYARFWRDERVLKDWKETKGKKQKDECTHKGEYVYYTVYGAQCRKCSE